MNVGNVPGAGSMDEGWAPNMIPHLARCHGKNEKLRAEHR